MNYGTMTLLPDHVSAVRRLKYDTRMAEYQAKIKLGVNARMPAVLTGRATWRIQTKPHIGMLLKRMFPGITGSPDEMYYAHSPESARNLEWFTMRYPMRVEPAKMLFAEAQGHRIRENSVAKLLAGKDLDFPVVQLVRPLWENQKIGVELAYQRRHLLIADEVGEGKTAQAIGLAVKVKKFTVIAVQTQLPPQWERAIADWTSNGLRTYVIKDGHPKDPKDLFPRRGIRRSMRSLSPGPTPDVVILSYSKLAAWAQYLEPLIAGGLFVLDEVQDMRTGDDSQKWDAAYTLSRAAGWVLGLSATPFYNYGGEFWNVAEIVSPGELGTKEEFNATWCVTRNGKVVIEDPVAFGTYLYESGLQIRRCRPKQPTENIIQWVDTDNKSMREAGDKLVELARGILSEDESKRGDKMRMSGQFEMWMRQATGIDKATGVADFVRLLLDSEERVMLFGHHRKVFDIWMRELKEFHPVMYTGSESPAEKDHAVTMFAGAPPGSRPSLYVGGKSRLFICANRAGAGLDGLQYVCRVAVIGEFDWSRGIMTQNIGRLDREGQKWTVLPYLMMSDTPTDHKIAEVNGVKRQQITGVVDRHVQLMERLQKDGGHVREMAQAYLKSRGMSAA